MTESSRGIVEWLEQNGDPSLERLQTHIGIVKRGDQDNPE